MHALCYAMRHERNILHNMSTINMLSISLIIVNISISVIMSNFTHIVCSATSYDKLNKLKQ